MNLNMNKQNENFVSWMSWETMYEIRNLKKENKRILKKTNETYIAFGEIPDFQAKLINRIYLLSQVYLLATFVSTISVKYQAQEVHLNNMFDYSTSLRSMTQGKGEFTMEYKEHRAVSNEVQTQLLNAQNTTKATD